MPRFLSQADVPAKLKKPHLDRYKRSLRESLGSPGLAPEQRDEIKYRLATLGQPKVYGVRPWFKSQTAVRAAPAPEPVVEPVPENPSPPNSVSEYPDTTSLLRLLKSDLLALGHTEGAAASDSMTKANLAEAIMTNRAQNGW